MCGGNIEPVSRANPVIQNQILSRIIPRNERIGINYLRTNPMLHSRDRSPLNVDTSLPAHVPMRTRTLGALKAAADNLNDEHEETTAAIAK